MKAISIYKTKNKYKIVTMYLKDTGTYILNDPIFLLDLNVDVAKLRKIIFESLNVSKNITSAQDNISSKELLKKMKESSYKKLYLNSNSCCIYWKKNLITIEPQICKNPHEGLEVVEEDVVKIQYNKENELNIAKTIYEILQKNYSTDSPSMH